jgi:hypothetical protein
MRLLCIATIICLILGSSGSAFAASQGQYSADLSTLETRFFLHTYPDDTVSQRLDRLDKLVFGRVRQGSDQKRMTSLLLDLPNESSAEPSTSSGEQTTPNSALLQPEHPVATENPQVQSDSGQSVDYYPTVTALEEQIAGKTETALPVQQRLAKLETIAFGKPSTSGDLAKRVDLLKQYVSSKHGGNENYLASSKAVGWTNGSSGLEAEVSSMEQEVFGKTYGRDNLSSRLTRLEKNVLPQQVAQTFTPIASRVNRLMAALNSSRSGSAPSSFASSNFTSFPTYSTPSTSWQPMPFSEPQNVGLTSGQQNVISTAQNSNATKPKHHSFLHKLGVVAGDVGGMAARSMMSGGYGW